jgi:hypothetical protein
MSDNDHNQIEAAKAVLLQAGALARCDQCGALYDAMSVGAEERAREIATSLVSVGHETVAPFKGQRTVLLRCLREVVSQTAAECACEAGEASS